MIRQSIIGLLRRLQPFHVALQRFRVRFIKPVKVIGTILDIIAFLASAGLLVCLVIYAGYEHTANEYALLKRCMRAAQAIFAVNVLFSIFFKKGNTFKGASIISWILNIGILTTLLPWIYPIPAHPWLPWLKTLLYSRWFLVPILVAYAVTDLSYGTMTVVCRRTNPSLILSGSFILFILVGTFLLMLPRCSYYGISFSDALFLSTSAVCITGLTPIDISTCLTPFGLLVLALLIQIGALGVMTFTSFFALFFTGTSSIYSQLLLRDVVYSKSMNALIPTLLYVLTFTLCIEAVGALGIFLTIHGQLPLSLKDEIYFSLFHSLSGFCNAGFSTIGHGLSSPALLYGRQSFYWVMSMLIVAGAIGFPLLANVWQAITHTWSKHRDLHLYSMNTKITATTFGVLLVAGAIIFFLLERNNTLAGMDAWQQFTQSVFNAVTPRSAGFASVNPARFLSSTLVVVMFLMWVGGASQSTAGGVKVNTLAAVLLNLRAIVTGRKRVEAFRRTISVTSIRRANSVITLSILSYFIYSVVILILEPDLPVRDLLFETLSALFTVGSSLGITDQLSATSEIVLASAMFLGRVGIISLLTGFAGNRNHPSTVYFPSDNLIIN